eukprot:scaffold242945_cov30-Cyclotella_meneghiniana.AAC.1
MGIMNDGMTLLRLDFIVYNGLNNPTFESQVGDLQLKIHAFPPKIVCAQISAPLPQQLDYQNISLWI